MEIQDRTVLEAASWTLASELVRRHPQRLRLFRGHPGGGQYDCLWLRDLSGGPGDIQLNRAGRIHVEQRFDGISVASQPMEWHEYLAAEPRGFLLALERAAGLSAPSETPSSTPRTVVYRVLAAVAATAFKSVHPIEVQLGFIDSSGYGGGRNDAAFEAFPQLPVDLLHGGDDEFYGQPGYRFWFVVRDDRYLLAIEQERGLGWLAGASEPVELMAAYRRLGRSPSAVAARLLATDASDL